MATPAPEFQNVAEWLGEEGDKFRAQWRMRPVSGAAKTDWLRFVAERGFLTQPEIEAEIAAAQDRLSADIAARNEKRPRRRRA